MQFFLFYMNDTTMSLVYKYGFPDSSILLMNGTVHAFHIPCSMDNSFVSVFFFKDE